MEQEFFDNFYQVQYEKMAAHLNKRGSRYRNFTRLHQIFLLISAALSPVIIALSDSYTSRIAAIVMSSLVAVLAGVGRIFRSEDAWMNARVTRNALWREATYYHAGLSDYANCEDRRLLFVERVTSIVDRYNQSQAARILESIKEPSIVRKAPSEHGD
jgi:Protein of unknown function (DUF4231)